ncbi:MAG: phage tail assembly chaperone [Proteobacteria bacterium]|nr:phage tail assembly chaperone [Pseudomonadota bacterium]
MDIYAYHQETGEFLSTGSAPVDPLESAQSEQTVYMLPAHAMATPPPEAAEGFAAVWNGTVWELKEDHRGETLYSTATGKALVIEALGPLPPATTAVAPQAFEVWDEVSQGWVLNNDAWAEAVRAERNLRLGASDAMALPDYPHADEASRQIWLDYRQALRDLTEEQGFPWTPGEEVWPQGPGN